MSDIKEINDSVLIPKDLLIQIYNMLYSVEVKGEAVKVVGYIEQVIEQYLK